MSITTEFILTLAPDASTQRNGQDLASGKKLSNFGKTEGFVWGECSGSGSSPYQVIIQLDEWQTKCNCPAYNRGKIPCKHGIGMLLYYAINETNFTEADIPTWAEKWINLRIEKSKPKEKEIVEKTTEEVEKANAKKEKEAAKKLDTFQKSLEDLQLWLEDMIRTGLAAQEDKTAGWGWQQATWMNNAKAEGVSGLIKNAAQLLSTKKSAQWTKDLLYQLGEIYFVVKTFQNLDKLPETLQQELKNMAFSVKKEQVLENNPLVIEDTWVVIGQNKFEIDDNLPSGWNRRDLTGQKIWLYGTTSHKYAYLLDFIYTGPYGSAGRFEYFFNNGATLKASLVFYPSLVPLRSFFKAHSIIHQSFIPNFKPLSENIEIFSQQLLINPWLKQYPFAIQNVLLVQQGKKYYLVDENRHQIPLPISTESVYKVMATTGNQKFNLTGEWNGKELTPYCFWLGNECYTI